MTDAIHYLSISVQNIRAFGGRQTIDLSKNGKPSRWCVILGENGVGKTTLLQVLAGMRPYPSVGKRAAVQRRGREAAEPEWVEPALADYDNSRILELVRHGQHVEAAIEATFKPEEGGTFRVGYEMVADEGQLVSADPKPAKRTLAGDGPLVMGYGAARHAGEGNLPQFESMDPTESLFDVGIELVDPFEVLETLHYALFSASEDDKPKLERFQWELMSVIAALIPGLEPDDIEFMGPRRAGGGIRVKTPSSQVDLSQLSLGAQTMIAWIVDLAWRLYLSFPSSSNPFEESAIVLIDEVELHLHPVWQRSLREQLLGHFPRVQFIVSTHAPVTAQESAAAGDPISIVRWEGDHSVILADPLPAAPVRLDEVATSLFEMESSLPQRAEALLIERRVLIRKDNLTTAEKHRLVELSEFARAVQSGLGDVTEHLERLMKASPANMQT